MRKFSQRFSKEIRFVTSHGSEWGYRANQGDTPKTFIPLVVVYHSLREGAFGSLRSVKTLCPH